MLKLCEFQEKALKLKFEILVFLTKNQYIPFKCLSFTFLITFYNGMLSFSHNLKISLLSIHCQSSLRVCTLPITPSFTVHIPFTIDFPEVDRYTF